MLDMLQFKNIITAVGLGLDAVGVAIIAIGAAIATAAFVWRMRRASFHQTYRDYRQNLGRLILLGLEFLVAGDIIRTVAVDPTYSSVGLLCIVVLIRTFLSYNMEMEIDGRFPWQRPK